MPNNRVEAILDGIEGALRGATGIKSQTVGVVIGGPILYWISWDLFFWLWLLPLALLATGFAIYLAFKLACFAAKLALMLIANAIYIAAAITRAGWDDAGRNR
jgi:hypothetical protein